MSLPTGSIDEWFPAAKLPEFDRWCRGNVRIYAKLGGSIAFRLNPAQRRIEAACQAFRRKRKPIRLRVLKYRQAGVSIYSTIKLLWEATTHSGWTALSIADKLDLPGIWLRRLRTILERAYPDESPSRGATNANELWFDKLNSRYHIASAVGQTPGMGETIQALHCSEVASWSNPDSVLYDLLPAVPKKAATMVLQESTGRSVGDWWYQRYHEAKAGEQGYGSLFLPWFIQPDYRADASDIVSRTQDEQMMVSAWGLDDEQLAWRRLVLRDEFHGDEAAFRNQFPATEDEAFMAAGLNVFTPAQVAAARATVRPAMWRGEIIPRRDPREFQLVGTEGGSLRVWDHDPAAGQQPERWRRYAIGADCQWGTREVNDFDCAYVECAHTGKVCAKLYGKWAMGEWARLLAALGWYYRDASGEPAMLAPERNSRAAEGVILPLLGQAGNDWRYPNLWVRDRTGQFGSRKPRDFGWLTDEHTKPEIVILTMERLEGADGMDWADEQAVNEMAAYVRDASNRLTAPDGQHDDCLMARMIAGRVAREVWESVRHEPIVCDWGDLTSAQQKVVEHIERMDDRERQRELSLAGEESW